MFLVRTDRFEPAPTLSWDQLRAERLHELRWWHLDEVADATETCFAPARIGELLAALVSEGPPPAPIDTGV